MGRCWWLSGLGDVLVSVKLLVMFLFCGLRLVCRLSFVVGVVLC